MKQIEILTQMVTKLRELEALFSKLDEGNLRVMELVFESKLYSPVPDFEGLAAEIEKEMLTDEPEDVFVAEPTNDEPDHNYTHRMNWWDDELANDAREPDPWAGTATLTLRAKTGQFLEVN